ncbi:MAG: hypothetical protein WBW08_03680, partial [Methyloceanibacter sp.]
SRTSLPGGCFLGPRRQAFACLPSTPPGLHFSMPFTLRHQGGPDAANCGLNGTRTQRKLMR